MPSLRIMLADYFFSSVFLRTNTFLDNFEEENKSFLIKSVNLRVLMLSLIFFYTTTLEDICRGKKEVFLRHLLAKHVCSYSLYF